MRLLISHRLVLMALAVAEISGGAVAGDELLLTANKWSEDFRAAMWLLA